MTLTTISQADLTKNPQEVVDRVQRGDVTVVEQSGQEQFVLLDPLDFRLLQALAQYAINRERWEKNQEKEKRGDSFTPPYVSRVLGAYLAAEINLGKAAELLGLHRLDLQAHLHRLGIPLHLGPASIDEARAEIAAALKFD